MKFVRTLNPQLEASYFLWHLSIALWSNAIPFSSFSSSVSSSVALPSPDKGFSKALSFFASFFKYSTILKPSVGSSEVPFSPILLKEDLTFFSNSFFCFWSSAILSIPLSVKRAFETDNLGLNHLVELVWMWERKGLMEHTKSNRLFDPLNILWNS